MINSQLGSWAPAPLLVTVLMFAGCSSDAPKAGPEKPAAVDQAAASPGEAPENARAKAEPGTVKTAETPEAVDVAAKAAAGAPAPGAAKAPTDKAVLEKAYVEIYCAQRKKETERLLEIYTRYGFADPKSWTASWTEAAKDDAWVAEITQKAIQACP